jgi:acetolactate synthase small subunit
LSVYLLEKIALVPVYVVCANEVQGDLDRELALIKEFSTGKERERFIEGALDENLKGDRQLKEYMHIAFSLYRGEINRILSKKGVSMTIVEKNIRAWNEQLGLIDKYKKEGDKERKLSVTKRMLEKGFSIEDIIDTTELTREEILDIETE